MGGKGSALTPRRNLLILGKNEKKLPPMLPKPINIVGKGTLSPYFISSLLQTHTPYFEIKYHPSLFSDVIQRELCLL